MLINKVNKEQHYAFMEAWKELSNKKIIVSTITKISYKLDKNLNGHMKLKFYNNITAMWQNTEFLETKEIFGEWIIKDE
ncbi:hypothetical protein [Clostridium paraputrificum]|uniref:hypothetical protein n=1 Tax=Clostridium paraputrificum TaxID=29363 RepID=UPI00232AB65A|nr:hypothetical protein [Clostridium paraputrificum]MDB2122168.1 hypothetical protein [Clostridium paraputrificum]